MERKIRTYGGYFEAFMASVNIDVQKKVDYCLDLLKYQDRIPTKFVKYIKDGLFELRIEWESNIYRVFFIFDGNQIVVLFNGFQKKTQKTPQKEILKALEIKKEYYDNRR